MHQVPPLIAIIGETASGKSALALAVAEQFGGELVCADSWTVYKGFDVGTAKPTAAERARVAHHMLDIAEPEQGFSAVEFQRRARAAIADITARGRLPVIVGGTGLYVDSLLFDYQFLPAPAAGVRDRLNAMTLEELQRQAHDDGLDTTGIDMRNKRRIIRLIENKGARPGRGGWRDNTLVLGIGLENEDLRRRVERRVDSMLAAGLEQEVQRLARRYGWQVEPMKGIGYREWQLYFEAGQTLEQTRQRIIAATMGLARRQRGWFGRNDRIQWLTPPNTEKQAVELVTTFIGHYQFTARQ